MDGPQLTDELIGAAAVIAALQRRERIEAKYPEVEITSDLESKSGKWEVHVTGQGTALYDSCVRMLAALETRYPV